MKKKNTKSQTGNSTAHWRAPDIVDMAGSLKPRKRKAMNPVKIREYMEKHYQRA